MESANLTTTEALLALILAGLLIGQPELSFWHVIPIGVILGIADHKIPLVWLVTIPIAVAYIWVALIT